MRKAFKPTRVLYVLVVAINASAAHVGHKLVCQRNPRQFDRKRADFFQHFKSRVVVAPVNRDSKLQDKIFVGGKVGKLRQAAVRAHDYFFQLVARVLLVKLVVNFTDAARGKPIVNALVKARVVFLCQRLQAQGRQRIVARGKVNALGGLNYARPFLVGHVFLADKKPRVVIVVFFKIVAAFFYSFLNVAQKAQLPHGTPRRPIACLFGSAQKIFLGFVGIVVF